ncbi:MAG: DM13 domain-containing protein [Bacteroidota bacterium]
MIARNLSILLLSLGMVYLSGCIGDDFVLDTVDPTIRIMESIDTLAVNDTYQFSYTYLNNVGAEDNSVTGTWLSSNPEVISIDQSGLATAHLIGRSLITVMATNTDGVIVTDSIELVVGENTVASNEERTGTIQTTSSYTLEGDFSMREENGLLILSVKENYRASSSLPGLYIYLTNNPNTTSGALEISKVGIFSGAHEYQIPGNISLNEYSHVLYFCKPFNVKVGDGEFDN